MTDINYDALSTELSLYHDFTSSVAVYPGAGSGSIGELAYLGLGLANESGEAIGIVKKILRRGYPTDTDHDKLLDELGDVIFYWTRLCYAAGIDPGDALLVNVAKLQKRKQDGTLKDR